jgi:hypothetical protein
MWVAMSRGSAAGILVATFAAGTLGGWLFRGGSSGDAQETTPPATLAAPTRAPVSSGREPVARETPKEPRESVSRELSAPSAAKTKTAPETALLKSVPTPGHWFRLAGSDTLSEVAKRAYGTTKRTAEIERANPAIDPTKLRPGTVVYIPFASETAPPSPPPAPKTPAVAGPASAKGSTSR